MRPLLPLLALLFLLACGNEAPAPEAADTAPATIPPPAVDLTDFNAFYQRFHRDSAYQLAHIRFPLEGLPGGADSLQLTTTDFRFRRADWVLHRPVDYEMSEFTRTFVPITEDFIIERVRHKQYPMGMTRRWLRTDGEWELIFYAGMNNLSVES